MHITKLTILMSAVHFVLVVLLFLSFGIGLEGKQHFGHLVFWTLMMPAALIPLQGFWFIPLNSIVWGFVCAILLKFFTYSRSGDKH